MNTTKETLKFNISYINSCVRSLRSDIRISAKQQQLGIALDKDFIVGINSEGSPFVQIGYSMDGVRQVSNMAI